jgi:iron complex outermembrane receptor protein
VRELFRCGGLATTYLRGLIGTYLGKGAQQRPAGLLCFSMREHQMGINRKLQFAVRAALAAAAATAVVPAAWSQQAAPATAANAPAPSGLEEVVVTGSRITSPNLTAISPITSVDAGYIGSTNLTRVEDILNNLPMVFAGQNSTVSNGADGTATVNLRGLGPQRTLVLINGRRERRCFLRTARRSRRTPALATAIPSRVLTMRWDASSLHG